MQNKHNFITSDDTRNRRLLECHAHGSATSLPESKVGTFTQGLYDEVKKKGWTVISMKNDWKQIFSFAE